METGASGPGYRGGAERLSERLFGRGPDTKKRMRSRVLSDVACGPVVETGASGPGYRGGAERLSERFVSGSIPFCLNVDPFPIPCPNPVSNPMP